MQRSRAILVLGFGLATASAAEQPCFDAQPWADADRMFRSSSEWLGGDSAFSIDLGNDRTLWLFGDSWIDRDGEGERQGGRLIRNSVAIQTGADPSAASIEFHWKEGADGQPLPFFAGIADKWFWPGHGIRLGDKVVLFLNRMRSSTGGLGFASDGWNAILIENPDDEPPDWRWSFLDVPDIAPEVRPGFASVLLWQSYVYAFGTSDPDKTHPVYSTRWPVEDVASGDLMSPESWHLLDNGQSELTILWDEFSDSFVVFQTDGFGPANIVYRFASGLMSPWSDKQIIYRPPEYDRPNVMIYAAKAHPQLEGADLVMTYATNTSEFAEHFSDSTIYYPRFVRLLRCD